LKVALNTINHYFNLSIVSCIVKAIHLNFVLAISLTSCKDALENKVCGITCNTTDHSQNVAFYKLPNTGAIIAQCVPVVGCYGMSQYVITQPNSVSTILSFMHSRQQASEWRCDYGLNGTVVNVSWASK
jgi:hypothetical protein